MPTIELSPLWKIVQPLDALRIEDTPDIGGYRLVFPRGAFNTTTASDLDDRFWRIPNITQLIDRSPFGTSATGKFCYVHFKLKPQEQSHGHSSPRARRAR
jgi:hypothetical protein